MTIDEAIAHEKELEKKSYMQGMLCHANPNDEKLDEYIECGRYHEQISEWLEELKKYKATLLTPQMIEDLKKSETQAHKEEVQNAMLAEDSYNKAIDDFVKSVICELKNRYIGMPIVDIFGSRKKWKEKNSQYLECENLAYKIAEQLKAGGKNEYNI